MKLWNAGNKEKLQQILAAGALLAGPFLLNACIIDGQPIRLYGGGDDSKPAAAAGASSKQAAPRPTSKPAPATGSTGPTGAACTPTANGVLEADNSDAKLIRDDADKLGAPDASQPNAHLSAAELRHAIATFAKAHEFSPDEQRKIMGTILKIQLAPSPARAAMPAAAKATAVTAPRASSANSQPAAAPAASPSAAPATVDTDPLRPAELAFAAFLRIFAYAQAADGMNLTAKADVIQVAVGLTEIISFQATQGYSPDVTYAAFFKGYRFAMDPQAGDLRVPAKALDRIGEVLSKPNGLPTLLGYLEVFNSAVDYGTPVKQALEAANQSVCINPLDPTVPAPGPVPATPATAPSATPASLPAPTGAAQDPTAHH